MVLFRYLTREVLFNLLLITSLLFVILISNEFVHYLNQAAGGKFATNLLWELIILESPRFLAILLPFSLFLAILLTYGRLYADHEMMVLHACGFSLGQLARLTLPLILAITVLVSFLNLWLNPQLSSYRNKLLTQTGTAIELQTVQPGSFQQTQHGHRIIYVEDISPDHKSVKNIFMAQTNANELQSGQVPWIILSAGSGYQKINPTTKKAFFIAVNGNRYQGQPGQNEYYMTQFAHYGVSIDSHVGTTVSNQEEALPTIALWHANSTNKPHFFSELQWRLSAPISTLLLALLAIPLSRVNPRQGKYLHLLPATIIYIIYLNLLLIGRNWVEANDISYRWGLWWIHGSLLAVILLTWCYTLGGGSIKSRLIYFLSIKR